MLDLDDEQIECKTQNKVADITSPVELSPNTEKQESSDHEDTSTS